MIRSKKMIKKMNKKLLKKSMKKLMKKLMAALLLHLKILHLNREKKWNIKPFKWNKRYWQKCPGFLKLVLNQMKKERYFRRWWMMGRGYLWIGWYGTQLILTPKTWFQLDSCGLKIWESTTTIDYKVFWNGENLKLNVQSYTPCVVINA